ncbi:hypothetical protein I545_5590 [Mycobacterium kansasii 662]|nr:hypothetical protein I545_5590 [Mycobacterium kansasii 662]KEP42251.1 hypothetical protein MKSMC1_26280 [Mycobacterium kansasii]
MHERPWSHRPRKYGQHRYRTDVVAVLLGIPAGKTLAPVLGEV